MGTSPLAMCWYYRFVLLHVGEDTSRSRKSRRDWSVDSVVDVIIIIIEIVEIAASTIASGHYYLLLSIAGGFAKGMAWNDIIKSVAGRQLFEMSYTL